MPLFEMEASPKGRRRVFVRAQLPLLLGTGFVAGVVAVAIPSEILTQTLQLGVLLIVVASVAAIALPWERWNPDWLVTVAVVDIAGIALIRTELLTVLPSVGMLAIFPVLWLAYGFRPWAMAVAIGGALFITSIGFVYRGVWPSTPLEWANVITLPALIVGVAIVVNIAASQLRRNRQRLIASRDAQAAALRQSRDNELLSRAILDTVTAGVAFYGADNRLVIANRIAAGLVEIVGFELDRPPYAGDNVLMADRETPIPYDQQIIPRALRGEEIADHVEWLGPPDQQIAIMASSRQVHRDDGALLGTVIVAYDITELAHAINIREEFLSTVSHELRTPLTSIAGYLELLEDSLDPTDVDSSNYLRVITRNTATLQNRISELLSATDTTAPLRLQTIEGSEILDRAIAAIEDEAHSRGQRIEVVRDNTAAVRAEADPERLQRAFEEILDNAVKFGSPGSMITVIETVTASSTAITIENTGPALSRGEQARIFDRFYRAPYAHHNAIQGFGLGLTLARNIIAAHNGRITVRSTPKGASFTTTIPTLAAPRDA